MRFSKISLGTTPRRVLDDEARSILYLENASRSGTDAARVQFGATPGAVDDALVLYPGEFRVFDGRITGQLWAWCDTSSELILGVQE